MASPEIDSDRKLRLEHSVVDLKLNKLKCKRAFTRYINQLTDELRDESPDKTLAKENLEKSMDGAVEVISQLAKTYKELNQKKDIEETLSEIDDIEHRYEETVTLYNKTFDESVKADLDIETEQQNSSQVGKDLWNQLKRVAISLFYGDVNRYEGWKAALDSCIDAALTSAEYKLLQLRQYLRGDALKSIEKLGHSASAYRAAKERL